jgi:D-sedoheptulose 7-phosphate isomerase
MQGELEGYFETLGRLGGLVQASDLQRREVTIDAAMAWAVNESERTKSEDAKVYFIGNGGSAAIASHMAIDWMKNGGFAAAAFNDSAALTCLSNDIGYEQVFALPLSRHAKAGDLLVAISSSGKSANILTGVDAARANGAKVMTLSGFDQNNPLRGKGDMNFYVPNGLYGFVEIAHLTICHAVLDLAMGWRLSGGAPTYAA